MWPMPFCPGKMHGGGIEQREKQHPVFNLQRSTCPAIRQTVLLDLNVQRLICQTRHGMNRWLQAGQHLECWCVLVWPNKPEPQPLTFSDLSTPYHQAESEAIRKAINKAGRPIVFSTSPAGTPINQGEHIQRHANLWRISGDFWVPCCLERVKAGG